jgi:hypothetical protein
MTHHARARWIATALGLLAGCAGCSRSSEGGDPAPAGSGSAPAGTWLRGSVEERFAVVARQLRGFDVAMIETGHRYGELYWAGQDRNWPYAAYQLEKIETAVAHAIQRRPKRAASAAMLAPAVAGVRAAVARGDEPAFTEAFAVLTRTCNACHVAEQVAFIPVGPPAVRASPVRAPAPPTAPPAP